MKKILISCLLISSLVIVPLTAISAQAADNNPQHVKRGFVSVSYTAEKEYSPDTVQFSVTVKNSDKKSMAEASTKNKEISNKVYNYFKSNINTQNGDFIKTSNYSASPVYTYKDGKRIFDRYKVSNNIIVHTKSLDKISDLIDKSIELGATNVNSLNFSLSEKDNVCDELITLAGSKIRSRANKVATAVGTTITGVKEVRTSCSLNQGQAVYAYSNMRVMKSSAGANDAMLAESVSTDIEPGNIKVYATVNADFFVK